MKMNKYIFCLILLLPISAFSQITENTCREIVQHSKIVLLNKQNGMPIDEMLKQNDEWFKNASKAQKDYANLTIQMAYSLPSFNDSKLNKDQLNDFLASQYLSCKKAIK